MNPQTPADDSKEINKLVSSYRALELDPDVSKATLKAFADFVEKPISNSEKEVYKDGFRNVKEHVYDWKLIPKLLVFLRENRSSKNKIPEHLKEKRESSFLSVVEKFDKSIADQLRLDLANDKRKEESDLRAKINESLSFNLGKHRRITDRLNYNESSGEEEKVVTKKNKIKDVEKKTTIKSTQAFDNSKTEEFDIKFSTTNDETIKPYNDDLRKGIPLQAIAWKKAPDSSAEKKTETQITLHEGVGIIVDNFSYPSHAESLVYYSYNPTSQKNKKSGHDLPRTETCLREFEYFSKNSKFPDTTGKNLKTFYEACFNESEIPDTQILRNVTAKMPLIIAKALIADFQTANSNSTNFTTLPVPTKDIFHTNQEERHFSSQLRFHFQPNDTHDNLQKASLALGNAINKGLNYINRDNHPVVEKGDYIRIQPPPEKISNCFFSIHKGCFEKDVVDEITKAGSLPAGIKLEKGRISVEASQQKQERAPIR